MIENITFFVDPGPSDTDQGQRLNVKFKLLCPHNALKLGCSGSVEVYLFVAREWSRDLNTNMFNLFSNWGPYRNYYGREPKKEMPAFDRMCDECGVEFNATSRDFALLEARLIEYVASSGFDLKPYNPGK